MSAVPVSFVANGNIAPCRFVTYDNSTNGKVIQADAGSVAEGDLSMGISAQWQNSAPWYPVQSGYAATAGQNCGVYTEDQVCLLEIAATITFGMLLKADANGKGINASADKDRYGAQALENGVSGDLIKVWVRSGFVSI